MARYEGPVCWCPHDEYAVVVRRPNRIGRLLGRKPVEQTERVWEGGWHYSTRVDERGFEVPDRRLHLNDADPSDVFYEYAKPGDLSWVEKHGVGNLVVAGPLEGDHPPEAYDDHPGHEQYHAERGSTPGRSGPRT